MAQRTPNDSVVQGRLDDNSLISLVCLVWDPGADNKTNVEVNPHNALSVWDENKAANLQESVDNNLESHKWNHEPRE